MSALENPPAFPLFTPDGHYNGSVADPGMTLRDYFAGQWLTTFRISDPNGMSGADIAARCYSMADDMLAERIVVRT